MENEKDVNDLASNPEKLEKEIRDLSLGEFNDVLDEILKDKTLSSTEKLLVAKDLHRITGREMTYETIGKVLGISKVGVMKVEKRALAKLRKLVLAAGITLDDIM